MSEDKSRKTEQATPKKLRDARKKGQVARGKEIVSLATLLTAVFYLWLSWDFQVERMKLLLTLPAQLYDLRFELAVKRMLEVVFVEVVLTLMLPMVVLIMLVAVLANVAQFGFLFSVDPIKPRFSKINPVQGFKRIFSLRQVVETLFSLAKVAGVAALLYWVVRTSLADVVHEVEACDVGCSYQLLQVLTGRLLLYLFPLLIVIAALDYLFQKAQFLKEQRMTKEELKREFKDMEGDPQIKGQRRGRQREMLEDDLQQRIKNARVLVTNLSSTAVALMYRRGRTPVPVVLAVGRGVMARLMIEVAESEGVVVADSPDLAETLAQDGVVDDYIPSHTIEAVARVMSRTGP